MFEIIEKKWEVEKIKEKSRIQIFSKDLVDAFMVMKNLLEALIRVIVRIVLNL